MSSAELVATERMWIVGVRQTAFPDEIATLGKGSELSRGRLLLLHPFLDENGLLRVEGRIHQSTESYDKQHPFIIPGKHHVTKMLIEYEHARRLHAGPTLVAASPGDLRL